MVFFVCDKCGESLKKNQVDTHWYRCKFNSVSCVDCNAVFPGETFRDHIKCISEDQKYGGKNFVAKENKGEVKQKGWVEQVESAVSAVTDPKLSQLLQSILGFANIPRKEAKFVNFLQNSVRIRDRDLCVRAWRAIADAAARMKAAEEKEKTNGNEEKKEENGRGDNIVSSSMKNGETEKAKAEEPDSTTNEAVTTFKWKKAIKRKLKEEGGEMRLKKLRKSIVEEFLEAAGADDLEEAGSTFDEKLEKAGVLVEGKTVKLK